MKISIVTPVYNDASTLLLSLSAVSQLDGDLDLQQIVVDDGSTDESGRIADRFAEEHSNVIVLHQENKGVAAALNSGLAYADGEFIGFVEADVIPDSTWLVKLLPEFADPAVMGAGGILRPADGSSWIARIAGYDVESKFLNKEHYPTHLTAAAVLFRREIFEEIGDLNESLINSAQDAQFSQRIIQAGHKLAYTQEAQAAHHYKPTFLGYLRRQYAYARYRPHLSAQILYPRDRNIAWQMGLTALLIASLAFIPYNFLPSLSLLAIVLLIQLPMTVILLRRYQDPVLYLLPLVMLSRNVIGLIGFLIGLLNKWLAGARR